jgi:hypothetical protein
MGGTDRVGLASLHEGALCLPSVTVRRGGHVKTAVGSVGAGIGHQQTDGCGHDRGRFHPEQVAVPREAGVDADPPTLPWLTGLLHRLQDPSRRAVVARVPHP